MKLQAQYRKRLIKKRIEDYDNELELNISVPKVKISDAISLCTGAWEVVTSETIYNCWVKTGILPSTITLPLPSDEEQNNDDNLNEIEETQHLLDQYNNFVLGEFMSAEEFILIDDDNNYGEEEITDEEIVNMVKSNENEIDLEEEFILQQKIPTSEVLESLDKVLSFLDNPPNNFTIELKHRNLLYNLKKQIILFDKNSKIQSVLDNWLNI